MPVEKSAAKQSRRARIRMYRVGLGDCFLLTFFNGDKQQHILIDCGMFAGSRLDTGTKEKDLQLEIVNHIAETVGDSCQRHAILGSSRSRRARFDCRQIDVDHVGKQRLGRGGVMP